MKAKYIEMDVAGPKEDSSQDPGALARVYVVLSFIPLLTAVALAVRAAWAWFNQPDKFTNPRYLLGPARLAFEDAAHDVAICFWAAVILIGTLATLFIAKAAIYYMAVGSLKPRDKGAVELVMGFYYFSCSVAIFTIVFMWVAVPWEFIRLK